MENKDEHDTIKELKHYEFKLKPKQEDRSFIIK